MIRRPAGRCRIDAIEPEVAKFQRIDEHIDRAYRIALVDPIIKAFRQQRRLLAIRPLNKTLHQPPAIQQGNHSINGVFTQSGPIPEEVGLPAMVRLVVSNSGRDAVMYEWYPQKLVLGDVAPRTLLNVIRRGYGASKGSGHRSQ